MNTASKKTCEPHASGDEPVVLTSTTGINVQFVSISPVQLEIKHAMKNSAPIQNKPMIPSLFQVASRFEDLAPAVISGYAPPLSQSPFVSLMFHPEKLEAMLKITEMEDRTAGPRPARRATRNATPKSGNGGGMGKLAGRSPRELKKIEFVLEAPSARSVKLAGDFTDWGKFPLDLMQSEDGVWFSVVPLTPGQYSYRFIVDGQWCDDPRSIQHVSNPFGTENAVLTVT
jgi:hypothetical protein